jgi:hypothetical protein
MMKFIKPEEIGKKLQTFSSNLAVTKGQFEIDVPGFLDDLAWNHMDQLHRNFIHNTYEEGLRIATGKDFAVSLTRWRKIPIFITVTDIRLKPDLFYQCMTIAGLIFVHFIIALEQENEIVHVKLEWHITSHKWLKLTHKILSKMFTKLNTRLQKEDSQIREQRYKLRKQGYHFASDPADYYTSNNLRQNTLYPDLPTISEIDITNMAEQVINKTSVGEVGFLVKKNAGEYLIWPEVCPHEGGDLSAGKQCEKNQIQCPWHGLRFSAIVLSAQQAHGQGYGFEFHLVEQRIQVKKVAHSQSSPAIAEECAVS